MILKCPDLMETRQEVMGRRWWMDIASMHHTNVSSSSSSSRNASIECGEADLWMSKNIKDFAQ